MLSSDIDRLVDRARRAYLRRSDFDGQAPRIADCDVFQRQGRDFIELRDADRVIAVYAVRKSGDLRFMPDGKYERRTAEH